MRLIALLALTLALSAQAGTWVEYARGPTTSYEYEPSLITHHNIDGKALIVWSRTVQNEQVLNQTRFELHCPSLSYRATYEVRYEHNEVVYQMRDNNNTWQYAVPDTVQMQLLQWCCTHYQQNPTLETAHQMGFFCG